MDHMGPYRRASKTGSRTSRLDIVRTPGIRSRNLKRVKGWLCPNNSTSVPSSRSTSVRAALVEPCRHKEAEQAQSEVREQHSVLEIVRSSEFLLSSFRLLRLLSQGATSDLELLGPVSLT